MTERIALYREAIKLWCGGLPDWAITLLAYVMPKHYLAQAERCLQHRLAMDNRRLKAIAEYAHKESE